MRIFPTSGGGGGRLALCLGAVMSGLALCSFAPSSQRGVETPFDPNALLSDAAFRDTNAIGVGELETFLRHTPYGRKSRLALFDADGQSAAEVVIAKARAARINPLVLVAKLQVEQSLVSRQDASPRALDFALGCECPDGRACGTKSRGFAAQVECAAQKLAAYFDELTDRGATRSLWRVGAPRKAACGDVVVPRDRATASLYTYTPFVLPGKGGNWLFDRVFRRFGHYLGYYPETVRASAVSSPVAR